MARPSTESVARARAFVDEVNARTVCAHCGASKIEWHNPEHVLPGRHLYRISAMVCRGRTIEEIKAELVRCTPLCRRCHMWEDGRLKAFVANADQVRARKVASPGKPCIECTVISKPLRRGLCKRCSSRQWDQALKDARHARGLKRPIGQNNPKARLLDSDIPRIRAMHRFGGISPRRIGLFFSVSRTCVSEIIKGIRWTHIDNQQCRDLERQASAEMFRRTADRTPVRS